MAAIKNQGGDMDFVHKLLVGLIGVIVSVGSVLIVKLDKVQTGNHAIKTTVGIIESEIGHLREKTREIDLDLKEHEKFALKVFQRKSRIHGWKDE